LTTSTHKFTFIRVSLVEIYETLRDRINVWITIAALSLFSTSMLRAQEAYEPKGNQYWRRQMIELRQGAQTKNKSFPNTKRLMTLAEGAILLCQLEEMAAALETERLWLIQRGFSEPEKHKLTNGPTQCSAEAIEATREDFKKAAAELRSKGSALDKLKSYYSTVLTVLKKIPSAPQNFQNASKSATLLQAKDKELLSQKSNELSVELELAGP
jgi:hypothetical protein